MTSFNLLRHLFNTVLLRLDLFCCSIFNVSKNRDSGLPSDLEEITVEQYREVLNEIEKFKLKLCSNQNALLVLTDKDINSLNFYNYEYYSQLSEYKKVHTEINCYEIKNDLFIWKQILNTYFFIRKIWFNKVSIRFVVENKTIKEKHKYLCILNHPYSNRFDHQNVPSVLESKIINFIFLPSHTRETSRYKLDSETTAITEKIESIEIKDNKLIISCSDLK